MAFARESVADTSLSAVRTWKEGHPAGKAIGAFPVYVPTELIQAVGALPVWLFGAGGSIDISHADSRIQSFVCSISRSTLELGLTARLGTLDGFVFPSLCDVARNLSGDVRGVPAPSAEPRQRERRALRDRGVPEASEWAQPADGPSRLGGRPAGRDRIPQREPPRGASPPRRAAGDAVAPRRVGELPLAPGGGDDGPGRAHAVPPERGRGREAEGAEGEGPAPCRPPRRVLRATADRPDPRDRGGGGLRPRGRPPPRAPVVPGAGPHGRRPPPRRGPPTAGGGSKMPSPRAFGRSARRASCSARRSSASPRCTTRCCTRSGSRRRGSRTSTLSSRGR